jgi:Zn-dependent protease with chaperone function
MGPIRGDYFDGARSQRQAAELHCAGGAVSVRLGGRAVTPVTPIARLDVTSRLGGTPRTLRFPDGTAFVTDDNDAVDVLLGAAGAAGLLHLLESRWRYVLAASVLVVAATWGGVRYGLPAAAESAARLLPARAHVLLEAGALDQLDRILLEESGLAAATRERLARRFAALADALPPGLPLQVAFRGGGALGANALALPGGTVIFTDELVELAANDEELVAVLAHELGHVAAYHGTRSALQGSALTLAIVFVTGDVSSLSSLAVALPVLLTQAGYSRDFEREADAFAAGLLRERGIPVSHLAAVLERLEAASKTCDGARCPDNSPGVGRYLSTHPPTAERLRFLAEVD